MIALAFLLCLGGLAALGLSMHAHHGWALHRPATARQRLALRTGGWIAVAAALPAAMAGWGPGTGSVGWLGLLSVASALLLLFRTYGRPLNRSR